MYYIIVRFTEVATRVAKMPISQGCHSLRFFWLYIYKLECHRYLHAKFQEDWPKKKLSFFQLKIWFIVSVPDCTCSSVEIYRANDIEYNDIDLPPLLIPGRNCLTLSVILSSSLGSVVASSSLGLTSSSIHSLTLGDAGPAKDLIYTKIQLIKLFIHEYT